MSKSKKIIKQWIIQSSSLEDFEYEIDLNLSIGWEILEGSYSVIQDKNGTVYSQALVWREKLSKDVFFDFYDDYGNNIEKLSYDKDGLIVIKYKYTRQNRIREEIS